MNTNKLLGGLAITAMLIGGLASCSNDLDSPALKNRTATLLTKGPKVIAYSGNHMWGTTNNSIFGTTSTRANGDILSIRDIESNFFKQEEEKAYLDEYLPEEQDNTAKVDLDFLFYTTAETQVELYPVYAQTSNKHEFGIFYYDAQGQMHEQMIWDEVNPWGLYQNGMCQGKEVTIPAGIFFGFYIDKGNTLFTKENPYGEQVGKLYSTASMNKPSYPVMGNGNWGPNTEAEMISTHAVTWVRNYPDGSSKNYMGFEDWADFDYQDLVFTLTPEVKTVDASTFKPGETEVPEDPKDENCEICGHPTHEPGECDKCEPGETECHPAETTPPTPPTPSDDCEICGHPNHEPGECEECKPGEHPECRPAETPETPDPVIPDPTPVVPGDDHTNEVEVNLGMDDKEGKYNETHTSIHVRSNTDVCMFIPMPLEYLCPADDMEIVQKHLEDYMIHGGTPQNGTVDADGKLVMEEGLLSMMEYQIEDWNVKLYVEFVGAGTPSAHNGETFPEEGIHIWTEGINADLMEYLQENYGDGITFEIWNYYNEETTLDDLKPYLDRAVIKFLNQNNLPDFFINAFGSANYDEDKDCNVSLDESQSGNYEFVGEGSHLNGSDHNKIYESKNHKAAGNNTGNE